MVFKVAGEGIAYIYRPHTSQLCRPDISLAAFGRKEIEIAEVSTFFLSWSRPSQLMGRIE
jgi:hypothetical protein